MGELTDMLLRFARATGNVVAETLWPSRCALCEAPGAVLCERCSRNLPYIDWWRACRRCGAPLGLVQCAACNPVSLGSIGREGLPFASCVSATSFSNESGRVVRIYKDHGERRLADVMALIMARSMPPEWECDAVTFVPATSRAVRSRGFDHGELLASRVADALGLPLASALGRPRTRDQRDLGGLERIANLSSAFQATSGCVAGRRLVLVDDVFTTGSTLCAATDALLAEGADSVRCLTFARV